MQILLVIPHSCCAGVNCVRYQYDKKMHWRFIIFQIYVRHEVLHNRYVVDTLRKYKVILLRRLVKYWIVPALFLAHGFEEELRKKAIS